MWEVLTRKVPYQDRHLMHVALEVLGGNRPKVPADCPDGFAEVMQSCWHPDPQRRPDMNHVVMFLNAECGSHQTP
jgi:hypothetical protein